MKQVFGAFAAAAVVFTIGSSLSLAAGHSEWIPRGLPVCAVVAFIVYRGAPTGNPRAWFKRTLLGSVMIIALAVVIAAILLTFYYRPTIEWAR